MEEKRFEIVRSSYGGWRLCDLLIGDDCLALDVLISRANEVYRENLELKRKLGKREEMEAERVEYNKWIRKQVHRAEKLL